MWRLRAASTGPQRELLRPDYVAASRSKYGAAAGAAAARLCGGFAQQVRGRSGSCCGPTMWRLRAASTGPQRELLRPDHVAASRSKYGAAAAGEEYEEEANAACELCSEPFFSASGKSALCLTCRELPASRVAQRKRARTVESGATSVAS